LTVYVCKPLQLRGEPVWIQAQQWYLRLGLLYLHHNPNRICSLPEVFQLFIDNASPEQYLQQIITTDNPIVRSSAEKLKNNLESSKPEQAGYGTLFESLNWLQFEATRNTLSASDLSINDLGQGKPIALFIQFEETRLQSLGSLMSVLYGHFLNCLIDNHKSREPVALFFDEIGNLPKIEGLAEKLHTIRSRMMPCWMYWQTITQMSKYSTIGSNGADIIMSSADLQMFFRNNAEETQKMVSSLVGVTDKSVESKSIGTRQDVWELFDSTRTVNTTITEKQVNVIEPHEVGELKQFETVTLYRGGKARGQGTPYFEDYKKYRK
jgi:type IV secretory pathway TraG/TraD family ATPase VirD4